MFALEPQSILALSVSFPKHVPNKHFPRRGGNRIYLMLTSKEHIYAVNLSIPSAPKGNNDDVDWWYNEKIKETASN